MCLSCGKSITYILDNIIEYVIDSTDNLAGNTDIALARRKEQIRNELLLFQCLY